MVRGVGNDSPSFLSRPLPDIAPALDRSPRSSWPTWGIVVWSCAKMAWRYPYPQITNPTSPVSGSASFALEGRWINRTLAAWRSTGWTETWTRPEALGIWDYKRDAKLAARDQVITSFPDLIEKKRERHDEFLLIASDGIWDRISNQDAVDMVLERLAGNEEARLSSITEALVERRGGC